MPNFNSRVDIRESPDSQTFVYKGKTHEDFGPRLTVKVNDMQSFKLL